jgi:hypothetical protein
MPSILIPDFLFPVPLSQELVLVINFTNMDKEYPIPLTSVHTRDKLHVVIQDAQLERKVWWE